MISFQMGLAAEVHDRDVVDGADLVSGGWEVFASPTVVWAPAARTRFFLYGSIPISQDYRADYQIDRWRAGLGAIYSFERAPEPPAMLSPSRRE
jgi:hypothetical protein